MRLEIVKSKGLSHNSYFLSDDGEALVVDPRRDCMVYTELAQEECADTKYILETHRNEDYVVGSLELQNLTGAEIAHSKQLPFEYGEHSLDDGDILNIGSLKIKALYTPGHTNDSMCYAIYNLMKGNDPIMVFTGDTLFVGGVGRTDLYGTDAWREQSEKLYDSLYEKLLPLGDHVIVYPAHGGGSVCGYEISDQELSTIGYERKTNPMLQLNKEAFVEQITKQKMLKPPYFSKMEHYNLHGSPLLREAPVPQSLSVSEFEKQMQQSDTVVVDTREPSAFAGSYIPGSFSIWLDGLSFFPGWVLNYEQRILLVIERKEDIDIAKAFLWRLGFDNIVGYLCPGIKEWRNHGKPIEHLGTLSPVTLKEKLDRHEIVLVDVREEREWRTGYIEGAERIYVGNLMKEAARLPRDKPIATTCSWGGRGSLGASILKRMGFEKVFNLLGGMTAWKRRGYSIKKEV